MFFGLGLQCAPLEVLMAAAPVTPSPKSEAAPLSEGARLIDVLIAPRKTFTDLRRSTSWWAPFLLVLIVSLGFVYAVDQKIGFDKVVENQIHASPKAERRMEQVPAAQRNQAMQRQVVFFRYLSYGYPAVILLWNLIIAAVLWATFKFAASANVKFKTALAIVMYAGVPLALKALLATLAVVAGASPDSFTFQDPVATNPGYFLNPADSSPFLYSLASALDVFMIWALIVTAIGFTCVSKVRRSRAMGIVLGWYCVFALGAAALSAIFA
jgi:Yip1 domain